MKRFLKLFLFIFFVSFFRSNAYHIVGGEIEMLHIGDPNSFTYRVKLIQYFDCAQTDNPGPDGLVSYTIFRKSDGQAVRNGTMFITNQEFVPYTNPDCALGFLCTLKVEYSHEITLDPMDFDDPDGYVITWERCCRNQSIKNLINPGVNGMTYTLHFPPIVDLDGNPFINSSPRLFPPLSDYACVNQLFYIDFAGQDDDGDSIVYSLAAPLDDQQPNVDPINPVPPPSPPPHPIVDFAPGYNISSMIPGSPPLTISNEGFITVTPTDVGLYVFSVKADEYRDGIKIGEARRDFQMLVVDGCNPPDPPEALVKVPGKEEYYMEDDTIIYVASQPKCFDLFVTDDIGTNVSLNAIPVNFGGDKTDLTDIFSFSEGSINESGDTLKVEVCVSDCPYVENEPYLIDLIAADDACPLPQRDTVRVTIIVEPPTNTDPYFINQNDTNIVSVPWNSSFSTVINGQDDDLDSLKFNYFVSSPNNIDLEEYGISFSTIEDKRGNISGLLNFNTDCRTFDFLDNTEFMIGIAVDDLDTCDLQNSDTIYYNLNVELPINTGPKISTESNITDSIISRPNFSIIEIETNLSGTYSLDLFSTDKDNDTLIFSATGVGFELEEINGLFSSFNSKPGSIDGRFDINLECIDFPYEYVDEYKINFITEDIDICQEVNADTIQLIIKINLDENAIPEIKNKNEYIMDVNNSFEIDIFATDADEDDILHLRLDSEALPGQFSFNEAFGKGEVKSILKWSPSCNELNDDFSDRLYELTFNVSDNSCPKTGNSIKKIRFLLKKPIVNWDDFIPPNAFSPDGDGINDVFKLTDLSDPYQNLPLDGCDDNFESIVFVDRTGVEVFKSYNKQFQWDGGGLSSGVYFYYIKYTKSDYRGTVTIVY